MNPFYLLPFTYMGSKKFAILVPLLIWGSLFLTTSCERNSSPSIAYFSTDATPPIGSPVAYAAARSITDSLSVRGVVITGIDRPVVLATVDWITLSNEGMTVFAQKLADAASTTPDRVSIHVLHQHDTPRCDFTTERLMEEHGLGGIKHDNRYLNQVIDQASRALKSSLENPKKLTHVGFGKAKVDSVASNRRILGEDGKVAIVRFSKSTDPKAIGATEGLIDPWLKSVTFWSDDTPVVTLNYYATHPQSYYGEGDVTAEFIGIARKTRETQTGVPQIFFIGAAGNVAAGKYNDGSEAMRPVLASRLVKAMTAADEESNKVPVTDQNRWTSVPVQLPPASHMNQDSLQAVLKDTVKATPNERFSAARKIAWLSQQESGAAINVSALKLGKVQLLHLPSELFVEYQLNAQQLSPEDEICTAGYGEGGQGYIGTEIAYTQGGYEVEPRVSMVAPESERVLMDAIRKALTSKD
jgi:hypothetical protein